MKRMKADPVVLTQPMPENEMEIRRRERLRKKRTHIQKLELELKRRQEKSIRVDLTQNEARAVVAAVVDCIMEGFERSENFRENMRQVWGDEWRVLRKAVIRAMNRISSDVYLSEDPHK